jgi:outer membrane protein
MFENIRSNFRRYIFHSIVILFIFQISADNLFSQKVGFISSQTLREKFNEAQLAEQRIQTIVDSWKREIEAMKVDIETMEEEIKRNRLVWTDVEKSSKLNSLNELRKKRTEYTSKKFEPGGEYDITVKSIMSPIETKIFAAVQEVSAKEGYDIILDQSLHPIPYVNFKYDLTVLVLKKLGVNVEELEKDLEKKISNDPRNIEKTPKTIKNRTTKRKASRTSRNSSQQEKEFEQEETDTETPVVPEPEPK